jgi:hypothetical protein
VATFFQIVFLVEVFVEMQVEKKEEEEELPMELRGKHCHECRVFDFLPFNCGVCKVCVLSCRLLWCARFGFLFLQFRDVVFFFFWAKKKFQTLFLSQKSWCADHRCRCDAPVSIEAPACSKCSAVVSLFDFATKKRLTVSEALAKHECAEKPLEDVCWGPAIVGARKCREKVMLLTCTRCKKLTCVQHRATHQCSVSSASSCRTIAGRAAELRVGSAQRVK